MLDQEVRYTERKTSIVVTITIAIVTLLAALSFNIKLLYAVKELRKHAALSSGILLFSSLFSFLRTF